MLQLLSSLEGNVIKGAGVAAVSLMIAGFAVSGCVKAKPAEEQARCGGGGGWVPGHYMSRPISDPGANVGASSGVWVPGHCQ